MTLYGLAAFALVYALAVATPGPGVAAVLARAIGHGAQGAAAFIAGFLVGDLLWLTCAVSGLAVLAKSAYGVFVAVRYLGAAYLFYLAWRLWRAAPGTLMRPKGAQGERSWRLFLGSLALTLGNPKTMVFFLAVLPSVVDLRRLTLLGYGEIVLVIVCVLPAVLGSYTLCAARARARLSQPTTVRWMQRGTGAVLAGAAVAVAVTR